MSERTYYAKKLDVINLWRVLQPYEAERVENLIPVVCSCLDAEALRYRKKTVHAMLDNGEVDADTVKSVVVDVIARMISTPTNQAPMTQMSESALGYSVSGTFLTPGGGVFIKRAELARLGILRQRAEVIDLA